MKEYMMIIGSKLVDNDYTELTLVPLTTVKKKKPLADFGFGNLDELLSELNQNKQRETKVMIRNEFWNNEKLRMGSHVTLELSVGEV